MTEPSHSIINIVDTAKRTTVERLREANDFFLPEFSWSRSSTDIMPAITVGGRSVRFGIACHAEMNLYGERSPWTPYPMNDRGWQEVTDYLLGKSDYIEVRE